jgi:hypothetical protein
MTQPVANVTVHGGAPHGQLNFGLRPGANTVARAITERRLTDECMRAKGYERR